MAGGVGQAVRWVCVEPGIFELFLKVKLNLLICEKWFEEGIIKGKIKGAKV